MKFIDSIAAAPPPSTIVVKPQTSVPETLAAAFLCVLVVVMMAARFYWVQSHADKLYLRPYQKLDRVLRDDQRSMYRILSASVQDIIALRNQEGWWPETSLLTAENIPPFDPKFVPAQLRRFAWVSYDGGSWVDYLGYDKASDITFILRLIDLHAGYHPHPHPGVDYDPQLSVAMQIWYFPGAARPYPGERLPEAGWLWLVQESDPLLKIRPAATADAPNSVNSEPGRGAS